MSILFVHERAAFTGGVEQNIADTVRGLQQRGVGCHLAYGPQFEPQREFLQLFESSSPCAGLSPAISILPTPTLAQLMLRTAARCVYLHKLYRVPESLLRSRVRTVQMVHDHDLCCPRRHKYYAVGGRICNQPAGWRCYVDGAFLAPDAQRRFGVRHESVQRKLQEMRRRQGLDCFLVASEFMQQELERNGFPAERIERLPLAVRPGRPLPATALLQATSLLHTNALPHTNEAAGRVPTVLYVGQLIRGKGVDLLLQSLARLDVPWRAVIVGRGNAEVALKEQASALGLEERVEFVGWVDNEQIVVQYAAADVVAVPSRWPEPFGMVGLEAMRQGRPVVAFRSGGIADWLQHEETGLLVAPQDTAAFAAALRRLLVDPALARQYGAAGVRVVAERFGFEEYLDRLQQVLLGDVTRPTESAKQEAWA